MLTSSPVGLGQTRPFPTALIILLFFPFYRKLSQTLVVKVSLFLMKAKESVEEVSFSLWQPFKCNPLFYWRSPFVYFIKESLGLLQPGWYPTPGKPSSLLLQGRMLPWT